VQSRKQTDGTSEAFALGFNKLLLARMQERPMKAGILDESLSVPDIIPVLSNCRK
jgi:hypothetical protein